MKKWQYFLLGFLGLAVLVYINPGNFFITTFAKIIGEYREPQYESDESVIEELKKQNAHYDILYRVKSEKDMDILSKNGLMKIPLIQIYDRQQRLLVTASKNECSWALSNFFIAGDTTNIIHKDTGMYEFLIDRLEPVQIISNPDTAEYTIVTGWAKFLPKKTEQIFGMLAELRKKHDHISFVSVNLDFREEWEEVK
jgi:hypothetical protein